MSANEELVASVEQAFEQLKTEYIKEEKLLAWLKEKGLSPEEAMKATDLAIRTGVIRFCYTSSSPEDIGKLVPHYKILTREDEMPQELEKALTKRLVQKDRKAYRIKRSPNQK
jgi:aryl-alcohol dehydrogenase-like predicted oxidoreductase